MMNAPDTHSQKAVSEILSSIRQIISEDVQDEKKEFEDEGLHDSDSDILNLTRPVKDDGSVVQLSREVDTSAEDQVFEPSLTSFENSFTSSTIDSMPTTEYTSPSSENIPMQNFTAETIMPSSSLSSENTPPSLYTHKGSFDAIPSEESENLISQSAIQESAAAFAELSRATQSPSPHTKTPPTLENLGSYTVDSLMRELMRPMLKDWLDAHLPSLVRTLVVEQIEKVLQQRDGPPSST